MRITANGGLRWQATAHRGTEALLGDELREIGVAVREVVPGAVEWLGDFESALRVCLWSRQAMRVLLEVGRGRAREDRELYGLARNVPWEEWMGMHTTFACTARASDAVHRNSHFTALRVKDAIADRLTARWGGRPDVDPRDPDISVVVDAARGEGRFFLELQGAPLNQRGYRERQTEAPLKETLAATLLRAAGYRGERPLLDPMCGSGTIAIEAAMIALDRAPGMARPMAFERWPSWDGGVRGLWSRLCSEAKRRARPTSAHPIVARDRDAGAVAVARGNVGAAWLEDVIRLAREDASELRWSGAAPLVATNPPWGERLEDEAAARETLSMLHRGVRSIDGARLAVIAPASLLRATIRLRPTSRLDVRSGKLPCQMAVYDVRSVGEEPEAEDAEIEGEVSQAGAVGNG